jgi:hypothetical protein
MVMPFRISNAPFDFQRFLNAKISHIDPNNVYVYLDNILIPTNTGEENIAITCQIIQSPFSRKLYEKSRKCEFLFTEVTFLGFNIRQGQLSPTEDSITNVNSFNTSRSTKQVCSFLGLTNCLRTIIKGYSTLTTPQNNLFKGATDKKKKNSKYFIWTTEANNYFLQIKKCSLSHPPSTNPTSNTKFASTLTPRSWPLVAILFKTNVTKTKRKLVREKSFDSSCED